MRLSKTAKNIGPSRPCYHCILRLLREKNIKYVYYSHVVEIDGIKYTTILREKLKDMLYSELTYISSGYRRKHNMKSKYLYE